MKTILVFQAFLFFASTVAFPQQSNCDPQKIVPLIASPAGAESADTLEIAKVADRKPVVVSNDLVFSVKNGVTQLSDKNIQDIQALKGRADLPDMVMVWLKGQDVVGKKRIALDGEDMQVVCSSHAIDDLQLIGQGGSAGQFLTLADCRSRLQDMEGRIRERLGSDHFIVIIFKPSGEECVKSKPRGTSGDLIFTGLLDDGSTKTPGPSIDFTKCDAPSLSPNNPEQETLLNKTQSNAFTLFEFPSRQCFGSSVEMTVKNKTSAGDVSKPFTLALFDKFRFSLQVGLLASAQHTHSFGLRKDGNDMKIFDKGPTGTGPEYVATVILYGLPHYFGASNPPKGNGDGEKEALASYFGRDPFHENSFADRLGLVLGAGLNSPGDRLVAGLSFEVGYGINLIGVYEYAKLKELVGVSEGGVFTGTAEQIPTRDSWKGRWVGGVSVDMRYFTRLIKRSTS